MQKIIIYPNTGKELATQAARMMVNELEKYDCTVMLPADFTADRDFIASKGCVFGKYEQLLCDAQLVITLGGDGTLLRAARHAALKGVPVLGVNVGNIGYLTSLEMEQIPRIADYFKGEYTAEKRMMLNVKLWRAGLEQAHFHALNEAVISKGSLSRVIYLHMSVNGIPMRKYNADGVIIATPTGSTAYSLSAGGPVIDPSLESILVTPICPYSLNMRPVLFSDKTVLEIKTPDLIDRQAFLTVDGEESAELSCGDTVVINRSKYSTEILRLDDRKFFNIFNEKLVRNTD